MAQVTSDQIAQPTPTELEGGVVAVVGKSPWQLFWARFRKDRVAIASGIFIVLLVVTAFLAPVISANVVHHGPNEVFHRTMLNERGIPKGPNSQFWFGADRSGRDVFVRTLYGLRASLTIALFATAIAMVIGVVLGVVAGFFRGWVDTLISRAIEIVLSLPLLLFALGLAAACSISEGGCFGGLIQPGLGLVIFVIAAFSWTYVARIIRGLTLSIREREFVDASRSLGSSNARIMFREILPNLMAPVIIYSTLIVPQNILFEAYLSFLGLGIPQTVPSWGRMISEATAIYQVAWWLMFFPGLFLFSTTLAFNLLGDGLRDALDPRMRV
jgi:ABC-type dipeptide/oligopeptide/nickel transport system permease subunit